MFRRFGILRRRKSSKADILKSKNDMHTAGSTINLAELESGNSARVLNFQGGRALRGRLEAMGILPGTTILKKSAIPAKGPVIVEKGALQFALGYEMAAKILVEPIK